MLVSAVFLCICGGTESITAAACNSEWKQLSSVFRQFPCLLYQMLVIDLDGGKVLKSYGDEEQIIPQKLQKALTLSLKDETGK